MNNPLIKPFLQPIVRPITRLLVGTIAIPLFRLFLKKVVRLQTLDAELEKDVSEWFRASLLLLVATRNTETYLFPWVSEAYQVEGDRYWVMVGFRLMLAIGVVDAMPDQELFSIIHPGPPELKYEKKRSLWSQVKEQFGPFIKGVLCQHLNRSSPVFAILAAIAPGMVGWICYGVAVTQYLIIGLVTSKDKAIDVLNVFDQQVARRREELVREFGDEGADQNLAEILAAANETSGASSTETTRAEDEKPG